MPQASSQQTGSSDPLDLTKIETELDGVEAALERLEAGSYFTDEITGKPLDGQVLANNPTARRA